MKKLLITLPCYNEELVLRKNFRTIFEYAEKNFPDFERHFLIIDNNSSDQTPDIARDLAQTYQGVDVFECKQPGRGIALKLAWLKYSGYDIYSYMDIDLATDLKDFTKLVFSAVNGYDVSVGSRYLANADIKRSAKREFMSRVYNLLLKLFFNVHFKDAQCGFKAFSAKAIREILPLTQDAGWFWDTEFMILAERKNLKTLEIPVSWREIRDEIRKSKVSPYTEAIRQLKNMRLFKKRISELT